MQVLIFNEFALKIPIHVGKSFWGLFDPLNGEQPHRDPQRYHLVQETSDWSTRFYSAHPFTQPPKPYASQWPRHSLKVPVPVGASPPASNIWFYGPTWLSVPNGISIGSVVSAQLMADDP